MNKKLTWRVGVDVCCNDQHSSLQTKFYIKKNVEEEIGSQIDELMMC